MITSTLFRHGVSDAPAKQQISHRLQRLAAAAPQITRVDIVLDQVPYGGRPKHLYQCHISMRSAGRKQCDVYVNNGSIDLAVADAFDQIGSFIRYKNPENRALNR
ncbi:hypothetical protein A8C75_16975 [Marinobacterium aestuarii]|uniref:30S ribosomal protein S30 n=1 Tax=Marinobacterium aestuarii TaxID=1821621 RepID=A0A1A9F1A5_9GAMM|nr:hypothetical protein [Marinobacterium aestuarii]ANG63996.1 hypothetical protein A8C75_16975 [Marinobacterium aestuarii]